MRNALLLHGTDGSPQGLWLPWLTKELTDRGWKVWCPQLPHAEAPNAKRYNEFLLSSGWAFDEDSVIVGHSAGAVAALHLLQNLPEGITVKHAILVGSFKDDLGWPELKGMFEESLQYEKIRTRAKKFTFIHSDNDPYCPLEHAVYQAEQLGGELLLRPGEFHFSIETGGEKYRQLPTVLEVVEAD